ncbi:MAG: hypothetical protein ACE366_29615 [Bradymonadia bacterium]
MRWWLLIVLCSVWACDDPRRAVNEGIADPEIAARRYLTHHVFSDIEVAKPFFADTVDPKDFPIPLVVSAPEAYTFNDIWRLRMIDNRAVITALLTLNGDRQLFDLWFEYHSGTWKVVGWGDYPRPADGADSAPERDMRLPAALAKATFRDVHEVPPMPIRVVARPEGDRPRRLPVKVELRPPQIEGKCSTSSIKRQLRPMVQALGECYARTVDPDKGRTGRLTMAYGLSPKSPPIDATLEETTLLATGLSDCVTEALSALKPLKRQKSACTVRVRAVFRPQ